jgi:hypothetical protein
MFSENSQENIFFYWDGWISDERLKILRNCVYSTRVFNPTKKIFIISNTINNTMIDDKYNITCVKWDISFFNGLNIPEEKIKKYMTSHPRPFSDLFRIVLLYKFGGSYIDTDDLAIKELPTLKNIICRSYDPHTCFYNNIKDNECIEGKYREIRGYDNINIFPRNDCWLNWDKEHYFLYGLLHDDKFINCDDVIDICGKWSWQSLTLEHCKKNINTIGIDWNLGLTLLYLYEDFVSVSSSWDRGCSRGEMIDIWNDIKHDKTELWGNWKVTNEEALKFYNIVYEQYPYVSHLWLHSKDGKQEWLIDELDPETLYSVSTWIYNHIRKKIKLYRSL